MSKCYVLDAFSNKHVRLFDDMLVPYWSDKDGAILEFEFDGLLKQPENIDDEVNLMNDIYNQCKIKNPEIADLFAQDLGVYNADLELNTANFSHLFSRKCFEIWRSHLDAV